MSKSQSFIFALFVSRTAPTDFLVRETDGNEDEEPELHIFDGCNRLTAIYPRGYLSHHLAAISMAAVYTDAVHIADGVVGLKQRSLAASDPTA